MTLYHLLNCAALAFGPYAVYYKATPLSEYGTWAASAKAALVYFGAMLVKLLLWASLLRVSDDDRQQPAQSASGGATWQAVSSTNQQAVFDLSQEVAKAAITAFVDLAGLFYALTQVTYRNISFGHKFQAVGLGWAAAQSLAQRLAPLWFGAGAMEFKWDYMLDAINSNSELVLGISLAAVGSLAWVRKNRPAALVPVLYALALFIVSLPFLTSFVHRGLHWDLQQVVALQLMNSGAVALVTWQLLRVCVGPGK